MDKLARWTLEEGLRKFRVPLTEDDLDLVWEVVDPDATGFADFGEYLRLALGEMNEARRDLVLKVRCLQFLLVIFVLLQFLHCDIYYV